MFWFTEGPSVECGQYPYDRILYSQNSESCVFILTVAVNASCARATAQYFIISDGQRYARIETGLVENPALFNAGTALRLGRGATYLAVSHDYENCSLTAARNEFIGLKQVHVLFATVNAFSFLSSRISYTQCCSCHS